MDGTNFTKRPETNEEFWARVKKARQDHDEAEWQEHLAWMQRMEERLK
jgi:hypothetical protein